MESNLEIRLLKDVEIPLVNEFHNRVYKKNRTLQQFEWEFLQGPDGKAIYVITFDKIKNKIVGSQCAIPLRFTNPTGDKFLTAKSEDTLVDPDYRGQKLFERMYEVLFEECRKKDIKTIWGFTYALKPFQKIGFETPFMVHQGIITFNISKTYTYLKKLNSENTFFEKGKIFILSFLSFIMGLKYLSISKLNKSYTIHENKIIEPNSILCNLSNNKQSLFYLDQNSAYLKWRILDIPYQVESTLYSMIDTEDTLCGSVVTSVFPGGNAYLCQVLFSSKLTEIDKLNFLKTILVKLKKNHVHSIRFWGFEHNSINADEVRLLKKLGFYFIKRGITFVWHILSKEIDLYKTEKLFLSRLYSQGIN